MTRSEVGCRVDDVALRFFPVFQEIRDRTVQVVSRPPVSQAALDKFVASIREGSTVEEAAKASGFTDRTARYYRASNPEFAAAVAEAYEARTDLLEQEAEARSLNRSDPDSARLLTFLLKGRRRRIYGDKVEIDATVTPIDNGTAKRVQELARENPDLTVAQAMRLIGSGE